MMLQVFMAFWGTLGIAVLFNVPKVELLPCGFIGGVSWLVYLLFIEGGSSSVVATYGATVVVAALSRTLSYHRKVPSTVFLISAIVPLVPGALIFAAMQSIITGDMIDAANQSTLTVKIAGVIGLGIISALSLPTRWFSPRVKKNVDRKDGAL